VQGISVSLLIEVVSTNWRDDYYKKYADYEAMGIPEYWIVDYAALEGHRFIGKHKQPTISVFQLINGEYQTERFKESDSLAETLRERIISNTFPELNLTCQPVFEAAFYRSDLL
jgi:Uma2 family endonuclease